jgi:hypothetical protein
VPITLAPSRWNRGALVSANWPEADRLLCDGLKRNEDAIIAVQACLVPQPDGGQAEISWYRQLIDTQQRAPS